MTATDRERRFITSVAEGEFNREIEVIAREDGLEVDESFTIPWEWIFAQLQNSESNPLGGSSQP